MLKLDQAQDFHGTVSGLTTTNGAQANSDQIDLANINFNAGITDHFNAATDTLTVSDGTNTAVIQLTGTYSQNSFDFVADGNEIGGASGTSGTIVYDPPAPNVPAPSGTIVATAPNQSLTGQGNSDNFVFTFANVGKDTISNFHPTTDSLQFNNSIFANAQAVLAATHDDGLGNTVLTIDAHNSITLQGVLKAQLHTSDFFVHA
jgi:hypothetical protein